MTTYGKNSEERMAEMTQLMQDLRRQVDAVPLETIREHLARFKTEQQERNRLRRECARERNRIRARERREAKRRDLLVQLLYAEAMAPRTRSTTL